MVRLRVGLLGFAHVHADGYVALLKSMPEVELIGFSEAEPNLAEQASSLHGLRHFSSHAALLGQDLDAVIVCTENARRREPVELAAAHGVHVLCEKPIEVSLQAAIAMRDACTKAGVNFMTAFPMRFDPSLQRLRQMVHEDRLGQIYALNGINHSEMPQRHRAWFAQKALAGGGAVMDHTVHLTDLYRWILGAEVCEVHASVGNPFDAAVDVDTAGLVTLTFENQVFAGIDCSWSRPPSYPRWGHLKLELFAECGAVALDAFAQHLCLYGAEHRWLNWGSDPNRLMLEEFFACIKEGRPPAVTWQDGFEALRVALACFESNDQKQPVALEVKPP